MVLVVEDDKGVRDLMEAILSTEGFDVRTARDGLEGLLKLRDAASRRPRARHHDARRGPPAVLDELASEHADVPVIVVTGKPQAAEQARERLGDANVFDKLFDLDEFVCASARSSGRRSRGRRDREGERSRHFEKPSTRRPISFEVGITELGAKRRRARRRRAAARRDHRGHGGGAVALRLRGRRADFAQSRLEALASAGSIPVINALSDHAHPCQALADLQTIREYKGSLQGNLAYLGDGNNVTHSLLEAGSRVGMHVAVGSPPGYEPLAQVVDNARSAAAETGGSVTITNDPLEVAADADVVYTDVWASMGARVPSEEESRARALLLLRPYQVNQDVLQVARPDAIVMHSLPAHRGEEITADVIDGQQSVVFTQAENRLHSPKALLLTLLA